MPLPARSLLWFTVGAAVLAWLAPGGPGPFLQGAASAGCLLALVAWRLSVRRLRAGTDACDRIAVAPIEPDAGLPAALALVRQLQGTASLQAALNGVVTWLRCELGVRASVQWVWDRQAAQVRLGDQPPSPAVCDRGGRWVTLDDAPLGAALRGRGVVADPRGGWVLPVATADGVVAVVRLGEVGLALAATTVHDLLELALSLLADRTLAARGPAASGASAAGRVRRTVRSCTVRASPTRRLRHQRRCRRECRAVEPRPVQGVCLTRPRGVGHNLRT